MDFGALLYTAQRNEHQAKREPVRCYSTSFAPPKKEQKNKTLSANIQKFLARKEEEERKKELEAKRKRDELLALRSQDGKAKRRIQAMLKRTKAANKAVIEDAIDDDNTAVTLGGPSQPDEDDYGYVSQEASALYNKLMDKYQSAPPEEPAFPQKFSKPVHKDLNSTKDRVRMALLREEEEEMMPHKRKRKPKDKTKTSDDGDKTLNYSSSDLRDLHTGNDHDKGDLPEEKQNKQPKPKRPPPPPQMDFQSLLKLAEKKQFEPVKIEPRIKEPKDEEAERPMTKKQKLEYMRMQEWRRKKEEASKSNHPPDRENVSQQRTTKSHETGRDERHHEQLKPAKPSDSGREMKQADNAHRIPKLNDDKRQKKQNDSLKRIPKLNDSKDNRMLIHSKSPKGNDARKDDKPYNSLQHRIPKINESKGDERHNTSQQKHSSKGQSQQIIKQNYISSREDKKNQDLKSDQTDKSGGKHLKSHDNRELANSKQSTKLNGISSAVQRTSDPKTPVNKFRAPGENVSKGVHNAPQQNTNVNGSGEQRRNISDSNRTPVSYYSRKVQDSLMAKVQERKEALESSKNKMSGSGSIKKNHDSTFNSKLPVRVIGGRPDQDDEINHRNIDTPVGRSKEINHRNIDTPVGRSKLASINQKLPRVGHPARVQSEGKPKLPIQKVQPTSQSSKDNRPVLNAYNDTKSQHCPPDRTKQWPSGIKPKQFPPDDIKPRQFPPSDVRRRQVPPADARKQGKAPLKRRIQDSDEYDSEMDDFIDDGPEEGEDYSKHIREIFGYDRTRYSGCSDDDECMESNFARQLKEEFVSTKIGILEDLEDIKNEQMEKKRKALSKKKRL